MRGRELESIAYISGPLTGVRNLAASRRYYEALAAGCERVGVSAFVPHRANDPLLHTERTPVEVFESDLSNVLRSNVIVAYIGEPSLGVGAELAIAIDKAIPVLALWRPGDTVSRFILGMLASQGSRLLECHDSDAPDVVSGELIALGIGANGFEREDG
jgi:nucleoside 2-deoxyribosyltransferase